MARMDTLVGVVDILLFALVQVLRHIFMLTIGLILKLILLRDNIDQVAIALLFLASMVVTSTVFRRNDNLLHCVNLELALLLQIAHVVLLSDHQARNRLVLFRGLHRAHLHLIAKVIKVCLILQ